MQAIRTVILGLAIAGPILAACSGGAATQPVAQTISPGDAARGKAVFDSTCIAAMGRMPRASRAWAET